MAAWTIAVALCGWAGQASAQATQCTAVRALDDFAIDGMLDDWDGIPLRTVSRDKAAGLKWACVQTARELVFAFDVADDRIIRVAKGKAIEDRISVQFGSPTLGARASARLDAFPGHRGIAPRRTWDGARSPTWLAVEDSGTERGFALELRVPLAKLPVRDGVLQIDLGFFDADQAASGQPQKVGWTGELAVTAIADLLPALLRTVRATAADIRFDAAADVDRRRAGAERVIAVGKVIAVLGDSFAYLSLPVDGAQAIGKPVIWAWGPDGASTVAVELKQPIGDGERTILALIGVRDGKPEMLRQIEIHRAQGERALTSAYALTDVGKGKARKRELRVTAKRVRGWTIDDYQEPQASDALSIHLPWDDDHWGTALTWDGARLVERALPRP